MKLKNSTIKDHYTLIKLYLLKHQVYKTKTFKTFVYDSLNFLEFSLKQILTLIHLYDSKNKKILFIGFPYSNNKSFLKSSNHLFIPKNFWLKEKSGSLFETKQKFDFKKVNSTVKKCNLVIFLNPSSQHLEILQEFNKLQIPLVLIGNDKNMNLKFSKYTVSAFTLRSTTKKFFFFLISTILKK